jgi:hypothetical protein
MTIKTHLIRCAVLLTRVFHSKERNKRTAYAFEDRANPQTNSRQSRRPEHDKRLGVPQGILWGLAISVLLWAIIRWALNAALTMLAGL